MEEPAESTESEAPDRAEIRLRAAWRIFYVFALFKLVMLFVALPLFSMTPSAPPENADAFRAWVASNPSKAGIALTTFYALSVSFCIAVARGLRRRSPIARWSGIAYAVAQAAGIFLIRVFGPMAIFDAVLGLLAFANLYVAGTLGAFDRRD